MTQRKQLQSDQDKIKHLDSQHKDIFVHPNVDSGNTDVYIQSEFQDAYQNFKQLHREFFQPTHTEKSICFSPEINWVSRSKYIQKQVLNDRNNNTFESPNIDMNNVKVKENNLYSNLNVSKNTTTTASNINLQKQLTSCEPSFRVLYDLTDLFKNNNIQSDPQYNRNDIFFYFLPSDVDVARHQAFLRSYIDNKFTPMLTSIVDQKSNPPVYGVFLTQVILDHAHEHMLRILNSPKTNDQQTVQKYGFFLERPKRADQIPQRTRDIILNCFHKNKKNNKISKFKKKYDNLCKLMNQHTATMNNHHVMVESNKNLNNRNLNLEYPHHNTTPTIEWDFTRNKNPIKKTALNQDIASTQTNDKPTSFSVNFAKIDDFAKPLDPVSEIYYTHLDNQDVNTPVSTSDLSQTVNVDALVIDNHTIDGSETTTTDINLTTDVEQTTSNYHVAAITPLKNIDKVLVKQELPTENSKPDSETILNNSESLSVTTPTENVSHPNADDTSMMSSGETIEQINIKPNNKKKNNKEQATTKKLLDIECLDITENISQDLEKILKNEIKLDYRALLKELHEHTKTENIRRIKPCEKTYLKSNYMVNEENIPKGLGDLVKNEGSRKNIEDAGKIRDEYYDVLKPLKSKKLTGHIVYYYYKKDCELFIPALEVARLYRGTHYAMMFMIHLRIFMIEHNIKRIRLGTGDHKNAGTKEEEMKLVRTMRSFYCKLGFKIEFKTEKISNQVWYDKSLEEKLASFTSDRENMVWDIECSDAVKLFDLAVQKTIGAYRCKKILKALVLEHADILKSILYHVAEKDPYISLMQNKTYTQFLLSKLNSILVLDQFELALLETAMHLLANKSANKLSLNNYSKAKAIKNYNYKELEDLLNSKNYQENDMHVDTTEQPINDMINKHKKRKTEPQQLNNILDANVDHMEITDKSSIITSDKPNNSSNNQIDTVSDKTLIAKHHNNGFCLFNQSTLNSRSNASLPNNNHAIVLINNNEPDKSTKKRKQ